MIINDFIFILVLDAVTIVLFQVLGAFANIPFDHESTHNIGVDVAVGITQFIVVIVASLVIGFIYGVITCLLTRVTHHVHGKLVLLVFLFNAHSVLEPVFLLVMGYLSYLSADLFAFSGIIRYII